MPRRPTLLDLANAAGVGVATVDRVVNGRSNVSRRSIARVLEAARQIGYPLPGHGAHPGLIARPTLALGFVLHKPSQAFYRNFEAEIRAACAAQSDIAITPHIQFSPSQAPDDFAQAIQTAATHGKAVAATAINHPKMIRLVDELAQQGVPVFSLLNDFAGRAGAGYFGLDNMKVGRLAGWMMATHLQRPCRVAVMVGGTRWHGQGLRETGFRAALREHGPQITITDTSVNLETRQVTYEATLDLLQRHADLAGIYVAGGGMEGAIAALREARPPGKVALIVNELTEDSRAALADRYVTMVIATPLRTLCTGLVATMTKAATQGDASVPRPAPFDPLIHLPESV
jgi:LacI family transcriptional regulator